VDVGPERALIVYETETAARSRLIALGFQPDVAAEVAVYLAQATDLPEYQAPIADALADLGAIATFVEIDALPGAIRTFRPIAARTIIWAVTDGIRFYRGASVPALARLVGFARYGSPATAHHLCQDKFVSLALAHTAGLAVPDTVLLQAGRTIGRVGAPDPLVGPVLVKPNMLGARIGIFADSRCEDWAEALDRAARLGGRYGERAIVQTYIDGDDVRVSYMNTGGTLRAQLGIATLTPARSEAGGAIAAMRSNETHSGARDSEVRQGDVGAGRHAVPVAQERDLRGQDDARSKRVVAAIEEAVERMAELLGLTDYFAMDFRVDAEGTPYFLNFEVCPAVTIEDFQHYLATMHGAALGTALARSMRVAFARTGTRSEA
jgi:D-alanine-D-alanine ligase